MKTGTLMKKESSKPKKQRKWHYGKPLHILQKDFSVHLSKDLRKDLKRRSLEARTGDTVKIVRGDKKYSGKQGKITALVRNKRQVLIEGIVRKKVDGTEKQVPFRASNLLLVAIEEKDNKRMKNRKKAGAK
nr:50S ribosomal protein L24P [uncultured archaeon]